MTTPPTVLSHLLALAFALLASSAHAEGAPDAGVPAGGADAGSEYQFDVAGITKYLEPGVVGDVLATDFLVTEGEPPEVTRPGSLEDVLTSIQAFNKEGQLAPGVAVELTPWNLGVGSSMSLSDYQQKHVRRVLSRASLSLATATAKVEDDAAAGDDANVRSAAALRIRFIDDSDWRLNEEAINCALDELSIPQPGPNPRKPGTPTPTDEQQKAVEQCFADKQPSGKNLQVAAAYGVSLLSPNGDVRLTRAERQTGLVSASLNPFGAKHPFQIIGAFTVSQIFETPATETMAAQPSYWLYGPGIRLVYRADWVVLNLAAVFGHRTDSRVVFAENFVSGRVQLRVGEDVWVETGVKVAYGVETSPNRVTFSSGFKWTYDLKPKSIK